jgi:hypothetical protein
MFHREAVVIDKVEPAEGAEGSIVTLHGRGFASHVRNNCVVVGGMGACARPEPGSTDTELRVRIGPVARRQVGEILMWPGTAAELFTEQIRFRGSALGFHETTVFRNSAPVASSGVDFTLTEESPNTYAGELTEGARHADLGGHEGGAALTISVPERTLASATAVDVCVVLKEPTLAIDLSADLSGDDPEEHLRVIAKSIRSAAALMGEHVFVDVAPGRDKGAFDLLLTKAYLINGMATLRFRTDK